MALISGRSQWFVGRSMDFTKREMSTFLYQPGFESSNAGFAESALCWYVHLPNLIPFCLKCGVFVLMRLCGKRTCNSIKMCFFLYSYINLALYVKCLSQDKFLLFYYFNLIMFFKFKLLLLWQRFRCSRPFSIRISILL